MQFYSTLDALHTHGNACCTVACKCTWMMHGMYAHGSPCLSSASLPPLGQHEAGQKSAGPEGRGQRGRISAATQRQLSSARQLSAPILRVLGQHILIEKLLQRLFPLVALPDVAVGIVLGEFDELALRNAGSW